MTESMQVAPVTGMRVERLERQAAAMSPDPSKSVGSEDWRAFVDDA
jgi:hypothetical protein